MTAELVPIEVLTADERVAGLTRQFLASRKSRHTARAYELGVPTEIASDPT